MEIEQTQKWLEHLTGEADPVMRWRAIHDTDKTLPTKLWRKRLSQIGAELQVLNVGGYGIFATINESNSWDATSAGIIRVRACYVDIDGNSTTNIPAVEEKLLPTMRVTSTRTPGHLYWRVSDCALDAFTPTQEGLVAELGTDPTITNLDRVMRVPGFANMKAGGPYEVNVEYATRTTYNLAAIHAVWPPGAKRVFGGGAIDLDAFNTEKRVTQARGHLGTIVPTTTPGYRHYQRKDVACVLAGGFAIEDEGLIAALLYEWNGAGTVANENEDLATWAVNRTWDRPGSMLKHTPEQIFEMLANLTQKVQ